MHEKQGGGLFNMAIYEGSYTHIQPYAAVQPFAAIQPYADIQPYA